MHLLSIDERLNNPKISKIEIGQRESFVDALRKINLTNGAHALSVSCGDGIWDYLALREKIGISKITATDIVECPVRETDQELLRRMGEWEFARTEPDKSLPFADETFDIVFHQDVIEHTEKPYLFVQEQCRVLRRGGAMIVGTPNLLRPANIAKAFAGRLQFPVKIGSFEEIGDYVHVQEFHEAQITLLMKECGLSNVEVQHVYFGLSMTNVCFSMFPTSRLGKTFAHFLVCTGRKA